MNNINNGTMHSAASTAQVGSAHDDSDALATADDVTASAKSGKAVDEGSLWKATNEDNPNIINIKKNNETKPSTTASANAWTLVSPRRKKAGKATAANPNNNKNRTPKARSSNTAALATKIAADATAKAATARSHDAANPDNNNNNNNNGTPAWKARSSDVYALSIADAANAEAKAAAITTTATAKSWKADPVTASAKSCKKRIASAAALAPRDTVNSDVALPNTDATADAATAPANSGKATEEDSPDIINNNNNNETMPGTTHAGNAHESSDALATTEAATASAKLWQAGDDNSLKINNNNGDNGTIPKARMANTGTTVAANRDVDTIKAAASAVRASPHTETANAATVPVHTSAGKALNALAASASTEKARKRLA